MSEFDPEELRRLERATAPYDPHAPGFVDGDVDQDAAALREGWVVASSLMGAPLLLSIDERRLVRQVLKRSARRRLRQRALVAAILLVSGASAWGWRHDLPGPGAPVAKGPTSATEELVAKTGPGVPKAKANQESTPVHVAVIKSAAWDDETVDEDLAEVRQAFVQMQDEAQLSSGFAERLGRDLDALEEDLRETKL